VCRGASERDCSRGTRQLGSKRGTSQRHFQITDPMIFVALPAYNEEDGIVPLLEQIHYTAQDFLPGLKFCIVVVDDGSTDATARRANECFARLGTRDGKVEFQLVTHKQNRGLAETLKTGLLYCVDKSGPNDVILTMDSDNSHTPGLIPSMTRMIYEGHDVVIASRFRSGARVLGLSRFRKFLSFAASWIFRTLFPIPGVRDYTCGYRAYRAELLKEVLRDDSEFISESGFSAMVDVLLKLRTKRENLLMTEVPLLLRYDKKLSASKMDVQRTTLQTLNLIWRRLRKQE
jgi:dolichol-phosphate mannosyltransferase